MAAQPGLKLNAAPARVSGWAVLTLDGLRLALPQRDMVTLELASVLLTSPVGNIEVGTFVQKNSTWPVYALDAALTLQAAGVTRRLCAFFRSSGLVQGILCDAVTLLPGDDDLVADALPGCMAQPHSPISGYALREHRVVAATTAQQLASYLEHLMEMRRAATI